MQQLIYFFQKNKYLLFFLMLQFIALVITFNNLNFHKSKFVNSANTITGGFYDKMANLSTYFKLKTYNEQLVEENTRLRNLLSNNTYNNITTDSVQIDTTNYLQKFTYTNAKVINNNYTKPFNFLTINKGGNQGIRKEMAVINGRGIVGITDNTTAFYSRVQSVLNRNSKINARLKNTRYFGTLIWNGDSYKTVQLTDIPRQAPVKVGDTIVTDGKSTIFPEGILIGKVIRLRKENTVGNTLDIALFNDMSNIGPVYVIKNLHKQELKSLENTENE